MAESGALMFFLTLPNTSLKPLPEAKFLSTNASYIAASGVFLKPL